MHAFIVEGHMEKKIVQSMCPGAPVRLLGVNGRDVSVDTIVERIYIQTKLLGNRYYPIFVILDREDRDIELDLFLNMINDGLDTKGLENEDIRIGAPDRTFETWFLPFLDDDCNISSDLIRENVEGCNGKAVVKRLYKRLGRAYVETVDGVELFLKVNCSALCAASYSFSVFHKNLEELDCYWLGT